MHMSAMMNFTPEEWKVLSEAPLSVGGAVAAASPSGVVGTIKEGVAIVNSMLTAAQHHPNNHIIQQIVPKKVTREQLDSWSRTARGMMQQSESERLTTAGVQSCQQVAQVFHYKGDPQETNDFKQWLLEIGENVAKAAKEENNTVPRLGSANVSANEFQILNTMYSALEIPGARP